VILIISGDGIFSDRHDHASVCSCKSRARKRERERERERERKRCVHPCTHRAYLWKHARAQQ